MRVLIAVTHLLGAGHLTRAAALARALASAGHAVTLVSGGAPSRLIRFDGVTLVQLPPVHVRGTAFARLLDAEGRDAAPELLAARRQRLLGALAETAPDVVVTELFPFGRRALANEFLALVEAAHALHPRPRVLASIRDILVAPDKHDRIATAHARVASLYDAVLVHGDPALVPLQASWPVDAGLASRLHYTGYVDEGGAISESDSPRAGILVSAGSSAAGLPLLEAAIGAARLRPDLGWHILAGHGIPEVTFCALRDALPDGIVTRARPDYRALLARAALSVSPCGYNTAVDLMVTGTRAVLVPFEEGRETEQRMRAERLAERGRARIVRETELSPSRLRDEVLRGLADSIACDDPVDIAGVVGAVSIIETLARQARPAAPALQARRPDWRPLRAALDRAADGGRSVPIWWRDDDAVAASPALDRLLRLSETFAVPILIAAIPAGTEPSLDQCLVAAPLARAAVHGLSHADHAPAGSKPAEFGAHRPLATLRTEAAEALRRARRAFAPDRLLAVFVPPWNRLSADLARALPGLGYAGLSAVPCAAVPGLVRADIHLDPIDWRGTRSLVDPDGLVARLIRAIEGNTPGPLGLLSHHRVHDAAIWGFLEALLDQVRTHPATAIRDPRDLFAHPVDEGATAWPSGPLAPRARMP
ncbi:MAG: glycosyl transferase family 28 [Thermoleophilia bacterium]|nr:glycosyl transferase family 28 [Beijerinckiaceae bacterium]MBY0361900.1 glycosyl transferase family 28 [Phreatobacter sp.]MBY0398072.1 glycosyl transferase family 28 [Thermoleophilia bacterium]